MDWGGGGDRKGDRNLGTALPCSLVWRRARTHTRTPHPLLPKKEKKSKTKCERNSKDRTPCAGDGNKLATRSRRWRAQLSAASTHFSWTARPRPSFSCVESVVQSRVNTRSMRSRSLERPSREEGAAVSRVRCQKRAASRTVPQWCVLRLHLFSTRVTSCASSLFFCLLCFLWLRSDQRDALLYSPSTWLDAHAVHTYLAHAPPHTAHRLFLFAQFD